MKTKQLWVFELYMVWESDLRQAKEYLAAMTKQQALNQGLREMANQLFEVGSRDKSEDFNCRNELAEFYRNAREIEAGSSPEYFSVYVELASEQIRGMVQQAREQNAASPITEQWGW